MKPVGVVIAYARTSTLEQRAGLEAQIAQLQAAGATDGDWAAFASLQQLNTSYDPMSGRPTKRTLTASSTTYAVSQFEYDAAGRLLCATQRMNAAQFGALPSGACTLGIAGADRIVRNGYDSNSRVTSVTVGYARTPEQLRRR